ncbi:MAG: hypothetical protein HGA45_19555 [Chloroflexales bacterium]|nr:hypothetical protein [Chloroflexales bacterium]
MRRIRRTLFTYTGALLALLLALLAAPRPTAAQTLPGIFMFGESGIEGNASTASITFTAFLTTASAVPVTVEFSTLDVSAVAPGDYQAATGSITFPVGTTSQPFTVNMVGDTLDENNETFTVRLQNPQNALVVTPNVTATILDDDATPTLSVNNIAPIEGTGGSVNATFTASLSAVSGRAVSFDFITQPGSATSPADFTTTSGSVTIPAGSPSATFSVPLNPDAIDEPNEGFEVKLSNAVNAFLTDDTGDATIVDDDGSPGISINNVSVLEGQAGTTNAIFTVSLQPASSATVTVDYATANDSAFAGSDYNPASGTLTFNPGETTKQIVVEVLGDPLDGLDETFFVNLTNPLPNPPVTIVDGQGIGTIIDDDGPIASINNVTLVEGTGGPTSFNFTINLSFASAQPTQIFFNTDNNTATAPDDYATVSGSVVIPAFLTSAIVSVPVVGDALDEINETFFVNLSFSNNGTIGDGQGVGTILDDDAPPSITIGNATITEGTGGTTSAIFSVNLSAPSGQTVTVNFNSLNGTASAPADYIAAPLTMLVFPPGVTSNNITLAVIADALDENDETFFVNLSSAANATIADNQGLGIITDDDNPPGAVIDDVTVTEGNSGTTSATFTVSLVAPASGNVSGKTITIDFASADGTALVGSDYNACTGSVTFDPGQSTRQFTCQVRGDTLDEEDETFFVDLTASTPANVTITDARGQVTIIDNDPPPTLSINDVSVNETDAPGVNASFNVSLSQASGKTVTVQYSSAAGTAASPADFGPCSGTLTFSPGDTSEPVACPIVGDLLDEENETFTVALSGPANATLNDGTGQATIIDNDPLPTIAIGDATVPTEGTSADGTVNAVFTVSLNNPSGREVRVSYATANGSALADSDYTAVASTVLVFPAGVTTQNVTILVRSDALDEFDENFFVNLSSPVNATIADAQGETIITDDDPPPVASIACPNVDEGNSGATNINCTVTLSGPSGKAVSVSVATANGSATQPADYSAVAPTTLNFAPGATTQTVSVAVQGDTLDEIDESFSVNLSSPTNATLGTATAQVTINDNDGPSISVDDASATEGDGSAVDIIFTVSLSAASPQDITLSYSSADDTAVSPDDYAACSDDLTIPAGDDSATFSCEVAGDLLDEVDEEFQITLTNPVDATIGDGEAVGTIVDNDPPPALSINDIDVIEGTSGTVDAIFTVSLSDPSSRAVSVSYASANGTAQQPGDYTAATGTLTFAPGETSHTVSVTVKGDTLEEADETFLVNLSGPVNATIADSAGTATILDGGTTPLLSIGDASVTEGNGGTTTINFEVTLSAASGLPVSVEYASADGTAGSPADYAACSGTLSFTAGATSRNISCTVQGDALDEANETFTLTLSSPVNAALGDATATGTITDDDPLPTLSIICGSVAEPTSGVANVSCTVTLSAASGRTVTVVYGTGGGTATPNTDYLARNGTLTFAPGSREQSISFTVLPDNLGEGPETFNVTLSTPLNATLTTAQALATINDTPSLLTNVLYLPRLNVSR